MHLQHLICWLAMAAYAVGGLILPATHVHHPVVETSAECNADQETRSGSSRQHRCCCAHAPLADAGTSSGSRPTPDVPSPQEADCPICQILALSAELPQTTNLDFSSFLEESVLPTLSCIAVVGDMASPPHRGPPRFPLG
ncbi:MAG: hypothetical protein R3C12_07075 [Planctomycetaceae bacterium]